MNLVSFLFFTWTFFFGWTFFFVSAFFFICFFFFTMRTILLYPVGKPRCLPCTPCDAGLAAGVKTIPF
jgi:hypothetical protein